MGGAEKSLKEFMIFFQCKFNLKINCGVIVSDQPKRVISFKVVNTKFFEAKIAGAGITLAEFQWVQSIFRPWPESLRTSRNLLGLIPSYHFPHI